MKQTKTRNLALISGLLIVMVFGCWMFALAGGGFVFGGVLASVTDVDVFIWMCVAVMVYLLVRGILSAYSTYGCYWDAIAKETSKISKSKRFVALHFKSAWYILVLAMVIVQVTGTLGYGAMGFGILLTEMVFILLVDALSIKLLSTICRNDGLNVIFMSK